MEIALIKSYTDKPWRSPATYQLIEEGLAGAWPVHAIETPDPEELHRALEERQQATERLFVFNIAEYLDESPKEGFLPALLEAWEVPHLGSSAEAIAIGLDKARTKARLMEQGIPTPGYFVAEQEDPTVGEGAKEIGFPLMVKPLGEGGHIGISMDSVVKDTGSLQRAVERVWQEQGEAALVEQYIGGAGMREFSVGILDGDPRLLVPMEIDFEAMDTDEEILSYEAAQQDLERVKLVEDDAGRSEIVDLALRTFAAVGARDYSRVDLRADARGCYVLEINVMPGLGPHSFLPEVAEQIHGLDYGELVRRLAANSMARQGLA